jgi:hypothetical protein
MDKDGNTPLMLINLNKSKIDAEKKPEQKPLRIALVEKIARFGPKITKIDGIREHKLRSLS